MYIFSDGSFSKKPKIGGMGAVIVTKDNIYELGKYSFECENNNIAEIAAIALAIQYIKKNDIISKSNDKTINIISDSTYALRKINQKKSLGYNMFEQKCLDYIRDFLEETNKKVSFFHTKGHQKNNNKFSYYNNIADGIAGEQRKIGLDLYRSFINKKHFKYDKNCR